MLHLLLPTDSFTKYNKGFMQKLLSIYQQFLYLCIAIWISYPELVYAGAGGTRGKNSDGELTLYLLMLPFILGTVVFKKLMKNYAQRAALKVIKSAQKRDKIWKLRYLRSHTKACFKKLQELWSNNDIEGSRPYLHPEYAETYLERLRINDLKGEFNKISNIKIKNISIVMAKDFEDPNKDTFVAHIAGKMKDDVYDSIGFHIGTNGDVKDNPHRKIDEYWQFKRLGKRWLLREISQDESMYSYDISIDYHSVEKNQLTESQRNEEIAKARQKAADAQSNYKELAFFAGVSVTVAGYIFYFFFLASILKFLYSL